MREDTLVIMKDGNFWDGSKFVYEYPNAIEYPTFTSARNGMLHGAKKVDMEGAKVIRIYGLSSEACIYEYKNGEIQDYRLMS